MSTLAEIKGVVAARQGLSCAGYFALFAATARLRESVFISVRDGDRLFVPRRWEHFPVREIEEFYIARCGFGYVESIGAGGSSPILFTCEGATERAAEEAAPKDPDERCARCCRRLWFVIEVAASGAHEGGGGTS